MAFVSCYKVVISLAILLVFIGSSSAQLSKDFYDESCPKLQALLTNALKIELHNDHRMAASLLRLHFHDCFVQGCDGSVLLDDTTNFVGEKGASPNMNSLRGFEAIDRIKSHVDTSCPGVVTCADILALAAGESVVQQGGPSWTLELGRNDSKTASPSSAVQNLPSPSFNVAQLIHRFNQFGFTTKELVALSGAHTIGQAKCINFRSRLSESNINSTFANIVKGICNSSKLADNNLAFLDYETPTTFDNSYFKNLVDNKGLLHSDQQLFFNGNPHTNPMVTTYQKNQNEFFNDFAKAMTKMSRLSPLRHGEIRRNCRRPN